MRTVAGGDSLLYPAAVRALATGRGNPTARAQLARAALTDREEAVLLLMARGLSNREIAHQLHIGSETVKTHVSGVLTKLGARDRTQAVILAYESGFLER
ncbi:response regulator transcription factor [Nocardia terrae]|uniref:response regulator transcription factor n=1 Tax=Nocardia terrae TaxID=2675851 RepID=UPI002E25350C